MSESSDAVARVRARLDSAYRSGDGDPDLAELVYAALAAVQADGGGGGGEDTGWVDLSAALLNGWAAGFIAPAYRKMNGVVYYRGYLNGAAATTGLVTTIPAGVRVELSADFPASVNSSGEVIIGWTMLGDDAPDEEGDLYFGGETNPGPAQVSLGTIIYPVAS